MMNLIPVSSSNLAAVGYKPLAAVLTIVFRDERIYEYFDVPATVHRELMGAESPGKFFHGAIRDCYPYRRVQ